MSSGQKKFSVRHPVVVNIGCGCRRPKLPSFFSSVPKPSPPKAACYVSPSTTATNTTTMTSSSHWESSLAAATSSPSLYDSSSSSALLAPKSPRRKPMAARDQRKPTKKKDSGTKTTTATTVAKSETKKAAATKAKKKKEAVEESVAVVKESSDPYVDFKESMLQMIVEMEIYAWDDLRDLLHRFLALNSPYHHHLILEAFAEIWNALFSYPSSSSSLSAAGAVFTSGHRRRR